MDRIAKAIIAKGVISFLTFGAVVFVTREVYWGAAGMAAAWLATLLFIDFPNARRTRFELLSRTELRQYDQIGLDATPSELRPIWNRQKLRTLCWMTLPLGATVTLGSLTTNVPRYFVERSMDASMLGVFAAVSYPLIAGSTVIRAMAQSASPRLSNQFAAGQYRDFRQLCTRLIGASTVLGIVGVLIVLLFGELFLRLVYGPEYAAYHHIFVWIMVDAAIGYTYAFLGTALSAMRQFRVQLPIHITTLSLLILSSWLLVSRFGLGGAVAAMAVAGLVEAALYGAIVTRVLRSAMQVDSQAKASLVRDNPRLPLSLDADSR
jgi:O-antigen/teichoic acid export membrane protein